MDLIISEETRVRLDWFLDSIDSFKSINALTTFTDVFDKLGMDGFIDTWHALSLTSDQIKIPREAEALQGARVFNTWNVALYRRCLLL